MKRRWACFLLVLIFVLAPLVSPILPALALGVTTIDVFQAYEMINAKPSLVVLDVRNQSEYDVAHLRNAKLIPLFALSGRLNELNKTDEILVYCKGGARSAIASQILDNNTFSYVYDMLGGIVAWIDAGFPVYTKYASIQQAINDAVVGSTVRVSTGVYYEHVIVNKSIALVGENRKDTVVDGNIVNGTADTAFYIKADNVSISDFTIMTFGCFCDNVSGVRVEDYRRKTSITNNIIINNGYGIKLDSAADTLVANNTITQSYDRSITAWNSSRISITGNNITLNTYELYLENVTGFNISNNIISRSFSGITLNMSDNGIITGNTISMNNPDYGIYIQRSSNNTIFHNNFIGNMRNAGSDNSTNIWTSLEEGNFWSDYNGTDGDNDGIGDTAYSHDGVPIDSYPLMGLFSSFYAGMWNAETQTVGIISNLTISEFNLNITSAAVTFNVAGASGNGFSRIRIPEPIVDGLLQNDYIVRVDDQPVAFRNWTTMSDEYIYISYVQGEHRVEIIAASAVPEFMFSIILPLFIIATLLAVAIHLRSNNPRKPAFNQR